MPKEVMMASEVRLSTPVDRLKVHFWTPVVLEYTLLTGPEKPGTLKEAPKVSFRVPVSIKVHEPLEEVTAEVSMLNGPLRVTDPAPVTLFAAEFVTTMLRPPFTISEPALTVVLPL